MNESSPSMAPSTWAFAIPKHATIEHKKMYANRVPSPLVATSNYKKKKTKEEENVLFGCII